MHKGVILVKKAGSLVPKDILTKVLERYPDCVGAATVDNGELTVVKNTSGRTVEETIEWMEIVKDAPAVFRFGSLPDKYNEDDLQPFNIFSKTGGDGTIIPELIAFVEGDFSAYAQDKSEHSDTFFFIQEEVIPTLVHLSELVEQDFDKVLGDLDNANTKNTLLNRSIKTGDIVFFASDGKIRCLTKNSSAVEQPWGWMSDPLKEDTFPKKDEQPPAPAPEEAKKTSKFAAFGSGASAKPKEPSTTTTKPEPAVKKPENKVAAFGPPPSETAVQSVLKVRVRPPAHLSSKDAKRDWYTTYNGSIPQGFKNRPYVSLDLETAKASGGELHQDEPIKDFTQLAAAIEAKGNGAKDKDKSNGAAAPSAPAAQQTVSKPLSVVSATEKQKLVEIFFAKYLKADSVKKTLDAHSQIISDPEKLQSEEKRLPTFVELSGKNLESIDGVFGWPHEVREHLVRTYPDSAAVLMGDLIRALIVAKSKISETSKNAETTTTKPQGSRFAGFGSARKAG